MPHWERSPVLQRAAKNRVVDERDERGHLQIFFPKADTCVTRVSGHLAAHMAQRWIDVVDPYFRRGEAFDTFHDWEEMTSYDSTARRALTSWVVANARLVRSAHFLVSSKLVAMGVSAAGLATVLAGLSMEAHTSRAEFERALEAKVG